jgi:hypothetical protein
MLQVALAAINIRGAYKNDTHLKNNAPLEHQTG